MSPILTGPCPCILSIRIRSTRLHARCQYQSKAALAKCLIVSQLHLGLEAARVIVMLCINCIVWLYFGNHEASVEWKQLSVSNRVNLRSPCRGGLALAGVLFVLSTLPERQTEEYVNFL
jgi:hypothetical protein